MMTATDAPAVPLAVGQTVIHLGETFKIQSARPGQLIMIYSTRLGTMTVPEQLLRAV